MLKLTADRHETSRGLFATAELLVWIVMFGMTEFIKMETLLSNAIFKTFTLPLHTEMFLVVHLYSNFSVAPHRVYP